MFQIECFMRCLVMKELYLKNNLKKFRISEGLSQKELAELVGVSRNAIASIECGQSCPSAKLAAMLCIAVGCSFEELFTLVSGL